VSEAEQQEGVICEEATVDNEKAATMDENTTGMLEDDDVVVLGVLTTAAAGYPDAADNKTTSVRRVTLSPGDPQVEPEAKRARREPVPHGSPQVPATTAEKQEALREFNSPADRALQQLVWELGCRYTMMAHQSEAVRAVAGFPETFPHLSPHDGDTDNMSTIEKFKAFPLKSKTKGILLADEMVSPTAVTRRSMILFSLTNTSHFRVSERLWKVLWA